MRQRIVRTAIAALAATGVVLSTTMTQVPANAAGPKIKWDYSMPDNIGPSVTGTVGAEAGNPQDLTGMYVPQNKMTTDPDYPAAGNALYGEVPEDGKYPVTLDACATDVSGDATYGWNIDGDFTETPDCKTTMRMTEGTKNYTLRVSDNTGSSQVAGTFVVKNVLLAIIGDSYASGEGFPPFVKPNINDSTGNPYDPNIPVAKYVTDWDETSCNRSRWSGFVRAANQLEKSDPHSNVTVLNVTCAGAQMTQNKTELGSGFGLTGGILYPKRPLNDVGTLNAGVDKKPPSIPSQIDQLNGLRKGQQIDVGMLSIGGNDLGLSYIMGFCLLSLSFYASCFGESDPQQPPVWQKVADAMAPMPEKFAATAACLTDGDCKTAQPGQDVSAGKETLTPATPLGITPGNVIQSSYPSLLRDENNQLCNRSLPEIGEITADDAAQAALSYGAPFKHSDSQWAEEVMLFGDGKPKDITSWATFDDEAPGFNPWVPSLPADPDVVTVVPKGPGLVRMFFDNVTQHGWSFAPEVFAESVTKGICASADTTVLYPVRANLFTEQPWGYAIQPVVGNQLNELGVMHPNNKGQELYRSAMYSHGKDKAGLPVPAKTQDSVDPTPPPINPPTKVKAKTVKKSCGKKYCHVKINFQAPTKGVTPDGYKIKTKVKGKKWKTVREALQQTKATWKKAPWKKKKFKLQVGAYATEKAADGSDVQYISWSKVKTYKIKR